MMRRWIAIGMVLVCASFVLSGCAKKPQIVKQPPVGPGGAGPYTLGPGSGSEVDLPEKIRTAQAQLKVVYFDYDRYALTPEAQAALQYNAEILRQVPNAFVVAEGHCDERGTDEYNLALGERRAQSVVDYLASLGVPPNRMSTVSYGSELPVDPGHNPAAWAKNRRVYLRVTQ